MTKYIKIENQTYKVAKLTKVTAIQCLEKGKVEFDKETITLKEAKQMLIDLFSHEIPHKEIELDAKGKKLDVNERMTKIVEQGKKFQEELDNLKEHEKADFYEKFADKYGMDLTTITDYAAVASDLPLSAVFPKLRIRVLDQIMRTRKVNYRLFKLIEFKEVRNGLLDVVYHDNRDTDDEDAYGDFKVDDVNQGQEPSFEETYHVDTNIHKGYDVIWSLLDDVSTARMGTLVSFVNDYSNAIAHPVKRTYYKRFITFLDKTASYEEVKTFTGSDAKAKAIELNTFISSVQTTSRTNLKSKPDGSTKALEYALNLEDTTIIMNSAYAANYTFDIAANTFQMDTIKVKVKEIIIVDFAKLKEYSTNKANVIDGFQLIIFEAGRRKELVQYVAETNTQLTRAKSTIHHYERVGEFTTKDKGLWAFK